MTRGFDLGQILQDWLGKIVEFSGLYWKAVAAGGLGIISLYGSVYACAAYTGEGIPLTSAENLSLIEDWVVMGMGVTLIQSAVTALITSVPLLLLISNDFKELLRSYGKIEREWLRSLAFAVTIAVGIFLVWGLIISSFQHNWEAVRQYVGIDTVAGESARERFQLGFYLLGQEILFPLAYFFYWQEQDKKQQRSRIGQQIGTTRFNGSGHSPVPPPPSRPVPPPPTL